MTETGHTTTVIAEDATKVDATWDGERPIVDPGLLTAAVGWDLKPEGLCRDEACIPLSDRSALEHPDGVDLAAVAEALGRPVLVDSDARMVAVGAAWRPTPRSSISRGRSAGSRSGRARGGCWSPSPVGEDAPSTCPGGRHCTTNSPTLTSP